MLAAGAHMEFFYHEFDKDILILSADGGLNAETAAEFVKQLESLVDSGLKKIIVDCSRLDYISSYGIAVLVRLHKKLAKHGGDVKVAAARSMVLKALTMMRMGEIFSIYAEVEQARLSFREKNAKRAKDGKGAKDV
jgi:anti-sigma B factor antagonist